MAIVGDVLTRPVGGIRVGRSIAILRHPLVVTGLSVLVLLFFRNHRLFLKPEFWAEDFQVYFVQARSLGPAAWWTPHNGFVQIICRIYASLAAFADPSFAPRIYTLLFIATVLATTAIVYTSPLFLGWQRWAAAASLFVAPVSSEVFLGMAYSQWIAGPLVALALCERAPTRSRAIALTIAVGLVGASSPFTLIGLPFLGFKLLTERSRYACCLLVAGIASSAIHAAPVLDRFANGVARGGLSQKLEAVTSILYRWICGPDAPAGAGPIIIAITLLCLVANYAWQNRKLAADALVYFFTFGVTLLFVSCFANGDVSNQFGMNSRYFYIPSVLFLWAAIIVEQRTGRASKTVPALVGVSLLLVLAHAPPGGRMLSSTDWHLTADCIRTSDNCYAVVNPGYLGAHRVLSDLEVSRR